MPKRNITVRDPVARSPLLRKGGVHTQSKTGQRVRARLKTSSAIDEWHEEMHSDFEEDNQKQEKEDGEQMLPVFLGSSSAWLFSSALYFHEKNLASRLFITS